jgi:hypothetical protein
MPIYTMCHAVKCTKAPNQYKSHRRKKAYAITLKTTTNKSALIPLAHYNRRRLRQL